MTRSSNARKERRALKSAGVAMMDRVTIDDGAIVAAAVAGASVVDLVALHVAEALTRLDAAGGDIIGRCVVTIGAHPDFAGGVTIEAKVSSRRPTLDDSVNRLDGIEI